MKISSQSPVETFPLPTSVVIPLSQHLGAPAKPLVKKGDKVLVGTPIGEPNGFMSAWIHSSVSGTVTKVDDTPGVNGYRIPAVFIDVEGDDWEPTINRHNDLIRDISLTTEEILAKIKLMGIVGLGGATFPAHIKLTLPPGKVADTLILDGVECEPFLTADHRLMLEHTEEILVGAKIMMKVLNVEKCIIGIEANKPDAAAILALKAKIYPGISVQLLEVKYPQGGEKQLIKALLNREVPSGKLPLDVGCIVNNVGTSYAVYQGVQKNKPLFERIMTVTGAHVANPSNFLTRIGTSVTDVLKAAGTDLDQIVKLVNGGPMMGRAASNLSFPVTKGTSGLIVFDKEEAFRRPEKFCIKCSKCIQACPMGLEPYLLEKLGEKEMYEEAEANRIMDCMECGSCQYTCPSSRPILDYIRAAKVQVLRLRRERSGK
ncbi:MAG: electron transporter RnfC [Spirochaetes bacterium GWB1_48_6]|nr:MAG: electron transporter RnfC [Spirochaetes bacterium GWB1_48_6]